MNPPAPSLTCLADTIAVLDHLTWQRRPLLQAVFAQPSPDVRTDLRNLALAEEHWLAALEGRAPQPVEGDPDAIAVALDETRAGVLAFVKSRPASVLAERCPFEGESVLVGAVLWQIIEADIAGRAAIEARQPGQLPGDFTPGVRGR